VGALPRAKEVLDLVEREAALLKQLDPPDPGQGRLVEKPETTV
jgi:hypothetical protein